MLPVRHWTPCCVLCPSTNFPAARMRRLSGLTEEAVFGGSV